MNIKKNEALNKLDKVFNSSIDRLIKKSNNRTIIIFMSGGLDSRLILSKLVEKGYKKILAVSYGIRGNSDSKIAKEVCARLNVKWKHISTNRSDYYNFFKKTEVMNFFEFADGLNTVPNFQDFLPVLKLKNFLKETKNYLIVNGQTGDFISGGHIPSSIHIKQKSNKKLVTEIFSKHFSLWEQNSLKTNIMFKNLENKIDELRNHKNIETENWKISMRCGSIKNVKSNLLFKVKEYMTILTLTGTYHFGTLPLLGFGVRYQ